ESLETLLLREEEEDENKKNLRLRRVLLVLLLRDLYPVRSSLSISRRRLLLVYVFLILDSNNLRIVEYLTAYDIERRNALIRVSLEQKTTYTLIAKLKLAINYIREPRPIPYRASSSVLRPTLKTLVLER
ncbi:hypothetical protein GGP41_001029, partial [Bipolaris sorokiniana]